MINRIRERWTGANPVARWLLAAVGVCGLALFLFAAGIASGWISGEPAEHPIRTAFGGIVGAVIMLAVLITFGGGDRK